MQLRSLLFLGAVGRAIYIPVDNWSLLTPSAPNPPGAITDYETKFGISIETLKASDASLKANPTGRVNQTSPIGGVNQIEHSQIQKLKASPTGGINQVEDSQIQNERSQHAQRDSIPALPPLNSQIQQPGSTPEASAPIGAPVNQINDGQIQNQKSAKKDPAPTAQAQIQDPKSAKKGSDPTAQSVNQICDGQIQNQAAASKAKQGSANPGSTRTACPVNQNGVDQNQDHNRSTKTTVHTTVVTKLCDGQIQNQESAKNGSAPTLPAVNQIGDGQIQNPCAKSVAGKIEGNPQKNGNISHSGQHPSVCSAEDNLEMTLVKSVLIDSSNRIGYVAENGQIQFDKPPQHGALVAIGWAINKDGYLSIGDQEVLYQCLSGTFYNLYIKSLGSHCEEVKAKVVHFTECS